MGLGFGALKAMNDSMKQNRDLLKANKRKPFEKNQTYGNSKNQEPITDIEYSEEAQLGVKSIIHQNKKVELRRKLLALVLSIVVFISLLWGLSYAIDV